MKLSHKKEAPAAEPTPEGPEMQGAFPVSDQEQEMGAEPMGQEPMGEMPKDNMPDQEIGMNGGGMPEPPAEMPQQGGMEQPQDDDSTMSIINQLNDKDRKAVRSYAESMLEKYGNEGEQEQISEENNVNVSINSTANTVSGVENALMQNKDQINNASKMGDPVIHVQNNNSNAGTNDTQFTQHVDVQKGQTPEQAVRQQLNATAIAQGSGVEISGPGLSECKFTKKQISEIMNLKTK